MKHLLDTITGGRALFLAGLATLLVATAFGLRYSFDHHWISESARCLAGALTGMLLMVFGTRRRSDAWIGEGALAFGAGVVDLSAWAATQLYHLVAEPAAFATMAGAGALLVVVAARWSSLRLALLGLAAVDAVPTLLADGAPHPFALAAYLLASAAVFLALAHRCRFARIDIAVFAATLAYAPSLAPSLGWDRWNAIAVAALFGLVLGASIAIAALRDRSAGIERHVLTSLNVLCLIGLWGVLLAHDRHAYGACLLALGAVLLGAVAARSLPAALRRTYALLALGTLTVAVPAFYESNVVGPVFALEGAFVAIYGWQQLDARCRVGGLVVLALGIVETLATQLGTHQTLALLNPRCIDLCIDAFAVSLAVRSAETFAGDDAESRLTLEIGRVLVNGLVFVALTAEALDGHAHAGVLVSVVWTAYGLAQLAYGIVRERAWLRTHAFVVLAAATLKVYLIDLGTLDVGARIITAGVLGAALVVASLWLRRHATERTA